MRLNSRQDSIDARRYTFSDDKGNKFSVQGTDTDWNGFITLIRAKMNNNNVTIPEDLELLVEDQMCMRLPKSKCYYTNELGDRATKTIHTFASYIDKGAKALGIKSNVEKAARGCSSCGKRRNTLNQWSKVS